jgi:hypothetical protein
MTPPCHNRPTASGAARQADQNRRLSQPNTASANPAGSSAADRCPTPGSSTSSRGDRVLLPHHHQHRNPRRGKQFGGIGPARHGPLCPADGGRGYLVGDPRESIPHDGRRSVSDQRGDRSTPGGDVTVVGALGRRPAALQRGRVVGTAAGVDQEQPGDPLGVPAQHGHRDVPTHGHAAEDRPADARCVQFRHHVIGEQRD